MQRAGADTSPSLETSLLSATPAELRWATENCVSDRTASRYQDRDKVFQRRSLSPVSYPVNVSVPVCVCVFVSKCPFHGRIIPRDAEGRPLRQEDRLREEQEERRKREEEPGEE